MSNFFDEVVQIRLCKSESGRVFTLPEKIKTRSIKQLCDCIGRDVILFRPVIGRCHNSLLKEK